MEAPVPGKDTDLGSAPLKKEMIDRSIYSYTVSDEHRKAALAELYVMPILKGCTEVHITKDRDWGKKEDQ
jgi:hypothetical protein